MDQEYIADKENHPTAEPRPFNGESGSRDGTSDKDIAITMVGEHRRAIDPATEASLLRKIDWFLVPPMICGYGLVYYDKVNSYPFQAGLSNL